MRSQTLLTIAAAAFVLLLSSGDPWGVSAEAEVTGYPDSIAVLGDSISQAANSENFGDNPENSWATGTNPSVDSVYSRLLAVHPGISGNRYNDSVSGAKMTHLNGQATNAVAQGADLVLILMGANDVCTSSEATMTSVSTFQMQFATAMQTLATGLPDSRISVGSIPNIYNLWDILHDHPTAPGFWSFAGICQSMLENPQSMAAADVTRRDNVRQRNIDFNSALANVCAQFIHCRFDNNAGFNAVYTPTHVSTIDYFHPSIAGEALAASVAWDSAPDFTDTTAPASSSSGVVSGPDKQVTIAAADDAGISGIEYRVGAATAWTRYTGPFTLPDGQSYNWRSVDLNGNTEATKTCVVPTWTWPPGDSDCDGFPDSVASDGRAPESFLGTDAVARCANTPAANDEPLPDAWPPDFDDNRLVSLADVLKLSAPFNSSAPGPPYAPRFDLNGSGSVTLSDVLLFTPFFNKSCTP